ncbi:MAG: hypothetical protein ACE5GW_00825 [Planctomycetota bacterium]
MPQSPVPGLAGEIDEVLQLGDVEGDLGIDHRDRAVMVEQQHVVGVEIDVGAHAEQAPEEGRDQVLQLRVIRLVGGLPAVDPGERVEPGEGLSGVSVGDDETDLRVLSDDEARRIPTTEGADLHAQGDPAAVDALDEGDALGFPGIVLTRGRRRIVPGDEGRSRALKKKEQGEERGESRTACTECGDRTPAVEESHRHTSSSGRPLPEAFH